MTQTENGKSETTHVNDYKTKEQAEYAVKYYGEHGFHAYVISHTNSVRILFNHDGVTY